MSKPDVEQFNLREIDQAAIFFAHAAFDFPVIYLDVCSEDAWKSWLDAYCGLIKESVDYNSRGRPAEKS